MFHPRLSNRVGRDEAQRTLSHGDSLATPVKQHSAHNNVSQATGHMRTPPRQLCTPTRYDCTHTQAAATAPFWCRQPHGATQKAPAAQRQHATTIAYLSWKQAASTWSQWLPCVCNLKDTIARVTTETLRR